MWQLLTRVQTLFLLFVILVCVSLKDDDLPTAYTKESLNWTLALPIIIQAILVLLREWNYISRMNAYDARQNESYFCSKLVRIKDADFSKAKNIDVLQKTAWGEIQVGDIVLLNKGDYCPADILILDMWDAKCAASTSFIDDATTDALKHSPLLTTISKTSSIKGNLSEYRRILTGKIDLKRTDSIRNFRGFVNLKKDPISERFGVSNLLQKYSQLKFSDWLVGIVVLCGTDSYSFSQRAIDAKESQRRGMTNSKSKWDLQTIISILMICFFSLLVIILRISLTCFKSMPFKGQMVPIAIDFVLTFPAYCLLFNQIGVTAFEMYSTWVIERKRSKYGSSQELINPLGLRFNYIRPISEIAMNTHVVFNSLRIGYQSSNTSSSSSTAATATATMSGFSPTKKNEHPLNSFSAANSNVNPNGSSVSVVDGTAAIVSTFCLPNRFFAATPEMKMQTEFKLDQNNVRQYKGHKQSIKLNKATSMNERNFSSRHRLNKSVNVDELAKADGFNVDNHDNSSRNNLQNSNQGLFNGNGITNFGENANSKNNKDFAIADLDRVIELSQKQYRFETFSSSKKGPPLNSLQKIAEIDSKSFIGSMNFNGATGDDNCFVDSEKLIKQRSKESSDTKTGEFALVSLGGMMIQQGAQSSKPIMHRRGSQIVQNVRSHSMNMYQNVSIKHLDSKQQYAQWQQLNNNSQVYNSSSFFKKNTFDDDSNGGASFINISNRSFVKGQHDQSSSSLLKKQQQYPMLLSAHSHSQIQENSVRNARDLETVMLQQNIDDGSISFMKDSFTRSGTMAVGAAAARARAVDEFEEINEAEFNNRSSQDLHHQNEVTVEYVSADFPRFLNEERSRSKSLDSYLGDKKNSGFKNVHHVFLNSLESAQKIQEKIIDDDEDDFVLLGGTRFRRNIFARAAASEDEEDNDDQDDDTTLAAQRDKLQGSPSKQKRDVMRNGFLSSEVSSENESKKKSIESLQESLKFAGGDQRNSQRQSTNVNSNQQSDDSIQKLAFKMPLPLLNLAGNEEIPGGTRKNSKDESIDNVDCTKKPKVQRLFKKKSFSIVELTQIQLIKESNIEESDNTIGGMNDKVSERISKSHTLMNSQQLPQITPLDASLDVQQSQQNQQQYQQMQRSKSNSINQTTAVNSGNIWANRMKQESRVTNPEDFNNLDSFNKRISVTSHHHILNTQGSRVLQPLSSGSMASPFQQQQQFFANQRVLENLSSMNKAMQDKSSMTMELLYAMTLCHKTKSKGSREASNSTITHVHIDVDTAGILAFAREQKFIFECACMVQDQLCYVINSPKNGKESVQIFNRFQFESAQRTIVICQSQSQQQQRNNEKYLIVRETASTVPAYLLPVIATIESKNMPFSTVFAEQKYRGERTVFYASKIINEDEYNAFQTLVRMEADIKQLESLYDDLLTSPTVSPLQLLGFLGMKDPTEKRMEILLKDLRQMGQKIWILTSDAMDRTLESCYNYQVLSKIANIDVGNNYSSIPGASVTSAVPTIQDCPNTIVDLSSANSDEIFYKIRNQLSEMRAVWKGEFVIGKGSRDIQTLQYAITLNQNNANLVNSPQTQTVLGSQTGLNSPAGIKGLAKHATAKPSNYSDNHAENQNSNQFLNSPTITQHQQSNVAKSAFALQMASMSPIPSQNQKSNRQLSSKNQLNQSGHGLQSLLDREKNLANNFPNLSQSSQSSQIPNQNQQQQQQNISTEISSELQLNFAMIVSGESLNILRRDEYLWNHFCLLLFYANVVVGVSLTDEQKSYLGSTLVSRFAGFSPRMLQIVSSLTDVERLNFSSASMYFANATVVSPHRSKKNNNTDSLIDVVVGQHCDFIGNSPLALTEFLQRESRFVAEIIEESMYLAVQRSFLLAEATIFWNIFTCACNAPLADPIQSIFFQGILLAFSLMFVLQRKRSKYQSDRLRNIMPTNAERSALASSCSPQNSPIFNLKSILASLIDAIVVYMFYVESQNEREPMMDVRIQAFVIRWGLHLVSSCRVFDLHHIKFDRYLAIYVVVFLSFITIDAYISMGNDYLQLMVELYERFYILNTLLFLALITVKCTLEWLFLRIAPVSLIGVSKYLQKRMNISKRYSANSIPGEVSAKAIDIDQSSSPIVSGIKVNKEEAIVSQTNNHNNNGNQVQINSMSSSSLHGIAHANGFSVLGWNRPKHGAVQAANVIRSLFREREMDIILSQMLMADEVNTNSMQMVRFFLWFQVNEIEKGFVKVWEALILKSDRIFNVLHFAALDIGYEILMLSKATNEISGSGGGYIISYAVTASAIFILTALSLSKYYTNQKIVQIAVMIVVVRSLKVVLMGAFNQIVSYPIEFILQIAIASSYLRYSHYNVLIQAVVLFVLFMLLSETSLKEWNQTYFLTAINYVSSDGQGNDTSQHIIRMTFSLSYWIIVASLVTQKYYMSLTLRNNYLQEQNLYKATIKVKDILSILLPKFIREKLETMKQGSYKVAERQDEVVIVFCDICNFDEIIFKEKTNSVRILDKLYREFDLSCQQNGLQKIETVGKTYLAAAGISDVEKLLRAEGRFQNITPSNRALNFALDQMRISKSNRYTLSSNKRIIIKIGVHVGPAISGVIGYHKPQFSLIGDTVNTTSRVCSTGVSDCITISKEVYNKVEFTTSAYLKFTQRDVEAKGKGTMITYQVSSKTEIALRPPHLQKKKKQTLSFLDPITTDGNASTNPSNSSTGALKTPEKGVVPQELFKQQMLEFKSYLSNHSQFNQGSSTLTGISGSQAELSNNSEKSFAQVESVGRLSFLSKKQTSKNTSTSPLESIPERLKSEIFNTHLNLQVSSAQVIPENKQVPPSQQLIGDTSLNQLIGAPVNSVIKAANANTAEVEKRIFRKSFDTSKTITGKNFDDPIGIRSPLKQKKFTAILNSLQFKEHLKATKESRLSSDQQPPLAGGAGTVIPKAGALEPVNESPTNVRRTTNRGQRKLNSMTIIGLKPRFGFGAAAVAANAQIGSIGGALVPAGNALRLFKDRGSPRGLDTLSYNYNNNNNNIQEEGAQEGSPLSPLPNEFYRSIEEQLQNRIELEADVIHLKELNLPIEKVVMQLQNDYFDGAASLGGSSSSYLQLGICSTKKRKSTIEQNYLHLEFIKQTAKQQRSIMVLTICALVLYYLIKMILVLTFVYQVNTEKESKPIRIVIYLGLIISLMLVFVVGLRYIQARLSWRWQRILIGLEYIVLQFLVVGQVMFFDQFMSGVIESNIAHETSIGSSTATISSVVKVLLPGQVIVAMEIEFIFMVFSSFKSIDFFEKLAGFAVKLLFYGIYAHDAGTFSLEVFFFIIVVGIVHMRIQYYQTYNDVRSFNNMRTLESKKDELDQLLENLLPSHILDSYLNSTKKEIPLVCEEHDNVTLLFADIAGFTKYSSTTDPIVVVNMLRKLFTEFDDHCFQQNVYKLYTIGDCYVCFGLIDVSKRNPAQEAHNVVRFAFDMIRIIEEVRLFSNCELEMRIGVHTGKIYGGIVGTEIVRYDVYGLDVITANKMESNGMNGRVTVSEATKRLLEDNFPQDFYFDFKEAVHIKQSETDVNAYLVSYNITDSIYDQ